MTNGYSLLDFGNSRRLEQWGQFQLVRPDPTAFGLAENDAQWEKADAVYEGEKGKGEWVKKTAMPESWPVEFDDLKMTIRLAPYKHTGAFPEQEQNWRWSRAQAKKLGRPLTVLNLFAYTGGATMALAKDGHFVTHIDASKPAITWAKENAVLNHLAENTTRWILDDAPVFVAREKKRGKKYDAIILDPPAFGHSPSGKTWRVERDLAPLLEDCAEILSEDPSFILINGYARQDTPESFARLLTAILETKKITKKFTIESSELLLTATDGRTLSTGIVTRCAFTA